jgi:hypothetical protein
VQLSHVFQLRVPYDVLDGIPMPIIARCFVNHVGIGCGTVTRRATAGAGQPA